MSRQSLKSESTADIVIVGGGIIGLAIAHSLAKRGARDVLLIEKNLPGQEASWAAGGILAPQVEADQTDDFFHLACASRDLYPNFAQGLRDQSGIDVELNTTGTLYVSFSAKEEEELRHRYDWQTSKGLSVEWLTGDEARALEPNISPAIVCALRFPNDWQVNNRRLLDALLVVNQEMGVRLVGDCEVGEVRVEQKEVRGVGTSSGFISAPVVVLAAGAWTSFIKVLGAAQPEIEIEPVRGQMLCFTAQPRIARHVIYSARGYLVPRRDTHILAGSTSERAGFEKRVTDSGVNAIKSMATEIIPELALRPVVDSWAGFRPRAADDLPVLGPCEEIRGLFYATGHYRNGILLAPLTGELIADAILNETMPSVLAPFSPSRFSSLPAMSCESIVTR